MSNTREQERLEFVAALAECRITAPMDGKRRTGKLGPSAVASIAAEFMRLACAHQRLQVNRCNRELSAREVVQDTWLEERITALAKRHRLGVNLGGDPRGYTVKLMLPTKRYNTWGGAEEGYGVPSW